jgi:hypothetical protein
MGGITISITFFHMRFVTILQFFASEHLQNNNGELGGKRENNTSNQDNYCRSYKPPAADPDHDAVLRFRTPGTGSGSWS